MVAALFPWDSCPPGEDGGEGRGAFDIISPRIGMIGCGKRGDGVSIHPGFSSRERLSGGGGEGGGNLEGLDFWEGRNFLGGGGIE